MPRKIIFILSGLAVVIAACTRLSAPPALPSATSQSASTLPAPTASVAPTAIPGQPPAYTPAPTFDLPSYLLTQAYAAYTPQATSTDCCAPSPSPAVTQHSTGAAFIQSATPVPTSPAATVILSEPIQIPNAVNTADCKISRVGNCTPTMSAGVNLFFTWTFGVRSSEAFRWGNAAAVVTRDNQRLLWTLVGNGLVKPPPLDGSWLLHVGEKAEFRAGLENVQPGHYTARLMMCTLSPAECSAGQGWQNVGGEAIDFVITS